MQMFYFIWKTLVHNVNVITKEACIDITGDETSWGHQRWGEPQSGMVRIILKNPVVCKGGEVVIVSDIHNIRPSTYVPRHNFGRYQQDSHLRFPIRRE